jgi:hypothetical protein
MRSLVRLVAALLLLMPGSAFAQTAPETPNAPAPAAAGAAEATEPRAGDGSIRVELNKLESLENACRAYFVVQNRTPELITELRLIVYFFDKNDVILASSLALPFNDVPAGRTRVALFEIPELACDNIGRVLVNQVLTCVNSKGAVAGCAEMVATSTRTDAALEY